MDRPPETRIVDGFGLGPNTRSAPTRPPSNQAAAGNSARKGYASLRLWTQCAAFQADSVRRRPVRRGIVPAYWILTNALLIRTQRGHVAFGFSLSAHLCSDCRSENKTATSMFWRSCQPGSRAVLLSPCLATDPPSRARVHWSAQSKERGRRREKNSHGFFNQPILGSRRGGSRRQQSAVSLGELWRLICFRDPLQGCHSFQQVNRAGQ